MQPTKVARRENYYRLPTRKRQAMVTVISLVGYLGILFVTDTLFPSLSDATKKHMTQAGLLVIFIASLTAGLAFVWSAKARHNITEAQASLVRRESEILLLRSQSTFLKKDFCIQINNAEIASAAARAEQTSAEDMPQFYEWCGSISMILVAVGTGLCFIGAG